MKHSLSRFKGLMMVFHRILLELTHLLEDCHLTEKTANAPLLADPKITKIGSFVRKCLLIHSLLIKASFSTNAPDFS